ncbi:Fic family protein [bacterium endosymbiont of Bathymodiolus sp. 5 South]|uniref:Fic family protein n=1 Tax=bacterium endosymbiont of Bathymodiolus sp. 5 South TaxID=1181670 RepID=UPI001119520D|nr:Fic family protein [bacterium endosymbiont of Bathymodiolus sp. 5 South]
MPNPKKALFLAKKQLSELVYDAVNLEGVNYTLPEVQTLLDGVTVGGHRQTDELIATNQIKAWQFLFAAVEEGSFEVSAAFTCQLQAKVAQQEALTWGQFRTGGVSIAGTDYLPPQQGGLTGLWRQLIQEPIPNNTDGIYQYAISLFLQMARIQFFYDGNKRTGRLMMNGVLLTNGLPVINLPASKQLEFNQLMLDFYPSNNEAPMRALMLSCLNPQHLKIMNEQCTPI